MIRKNRTVFRFGRPQSRDWQSTTVKVAGHGKFYANGGFLNATEIVRWYPKTTFEFSSNVTYPSQGFWWLKFLATATQKNPELRNVLPKYEGVLREMAADMSAYMRRSEGDTAPQGIPGFFEKLGQVPPVK